jgi:hypothetical protein
MSLAGSSLKKSTASIEKRKCKISPKLLRTPTADAGEILHAMFRPLRSPLPEIPCVLVRLDHIACRILNPNRGIV